MPAPATAPAGGGARGGWGSLARWGDDVARIDRLAGGVVNPTGAPADPDRVYKLVPRR